MAQLTLIIINTVNIIFSPECYNNDYYNEMIT